MNHIFPACEAITSPIRADVDLCANALCSSSEIALILRVVVEAVCILEYLEQYCLRNKSGVYARYAVGHVTRHLGKMMVVDITDKTVTEYQTKRLKEGAAPKSI